VPRNPRLVAVERLRKVSTNRQAAEKSLTSLRNQEHLEIAKARTAGVTQVEIARICRLTPQRIAQLLRRTDLTEAERRTVSPPEGATKG
jgi:hypothetical protein